MDVAMMQPGFMPWLGVFELIYKSEIFIFLDDFQFSVQSFHQRNRLFVNKEWTGWYTAPVKKSISFKQPLNKTKINESIPWRKKMWERLRCNYSKAPFFPKVGPHVEEWLFDVKESLAEQNIYFIELACRLLNIKCDFKRSSVYTTAARRSHRVLELLRWCNAKRYFCANGSFDYMREDNIFPVNDIDVLFQDFRPQPYKQIGVKEDAFVPFLSVLDAFMNIGPEKTLSLIKTGTKKWLTWQERASL